MILILELKQNKIFAKNQQRKVNQLSKGGVQDFQQVTVKNDYIFQTEVYFRKLLKALLKAMHWVLKALSKAMAVESMHWLLKAMHQLSKVMCTDCQKWFLKV